jgi:hypothetical protein
MALSCRPAFAAASGSLMALHAPELTRAGRSAVLARRTAAGLSVRPAAPVRVGCISGVGRFWMERARRPTAGSAHRSGRARSARWLGPLAQGFQAGRAPGRRTRAARDESADAGGRAQKDSWVWATQTPGREYSRTRAGPAARILNPSPTATDGATGATRREAWVTGFDCGAGAVLLQALPHRPGGRVSTRLNARGFYAPLPCARPGRGRESLNMMKRTEHNSAARRRGELPRERGSLRLSPAIDARRRLNIRRADGAGTKALPLGPSDPRHAYLTQSHD